MDISKRLAEMDQSWKSKILEGMMLIREGCRKNDFWPACSECPFDDYCDMIIGRGGDSALDTPDTWAFEGEPESVCEECKYFDTCGSNDRDQACDGFERSEVFRESN